MMILVTATKPARTRDYVVLRGDAKTEPCQDRSSGFQDCQHYHNQQNDGDDIKIARQYTVA